VPQWSISVTLVPFRIRDKIPAIFLVEPSTFPLEFASDIGEQGFMLFVTDSKEVGTIDWIVGLSRGKVYTTRAVPIR
jgi:hypothetical protein